MKKTLNILQVNHGDNLGGAGTIAFELFNALNKIGYNTFFVVGIKGRSESRIIELSMTQKMGVFELLFTKISHKFQKIPVLRIFSFLIKYIARPSIFSVKIRNYIKGYDDFTHPETSGIIGLIPHYPPDLIHCHSLNWGFFDLKMLPDINKKVPIVITHHDAWYISGFCQHSLNCTRWREGCGQCPLFSKKWSIRRDGTAYNWEKKREIFEKCHLYSITPCQWLMDKVNQSMMSVGIIGSKVIPNGVDLQTFFPTDKKKACNELKMTCDQKILLFVGANLKKSQWKDYNALISTMKEIAKSGKQVLCLILGKKGNSIFFNKVEIRFIAYVRDPNVIATYYNAADVYVHPARVDTFPTVILEALACGTPVVASAVGGIPEQIIDGKTGFLVPPGDSQMMAERIIYLLENEEIMHQMGKQAAEDAKDRFGLERMVNEYIQVYEELVSGESVL